MGILDKFTMGKAISGGLPLVFAGMAYSDKRNEGSSVAGAATYAAADAMMTYAMGPFNYLGLQLLSAAPSLAVDTTRALGKFARSNSRYLNNANRPFGNSTFMDNNNIATMRQAGMALAERSQYNVQQALMGNEARYIHR